MNVKPGNDKRRNEVRIAVVQMNPVFGEKETNIKRMLDFIDKASEKRADLIVFPELCNTGYMFKNRSELARLSEEIPAGDTVKAWTVKAKENNVYIIAGLAEKEDGKLYNSAVLIGPEGYLGKYRKCHLWYKEKLIFEPGNLGLPVFDLPFARLGIQICYDFYFVEGTRILALKGADIVVVSTNWPAGKPEATWDEKGYCMGNYRAMVHSNANKIYVACANRIGNERGQLFSGCSIVTGPNGWPISGPAAKDREEILYADIDIEEGRRIRLLNLDENLRERRCDLYDEMLGYHEVAREPR
ncbi:MAG: Aliphatic amidase AmiE [Firmicutes bacterium]|nr:Aliphatic amidase AmiE [Bacillota bacterium]MDI6706329.1 nitrilase family protein [Bacillota bacterium]